MFRSSTSVVWTVAAALLLLSLFSAIPFTQAVGTSSMSTSHTALQQTRLSNWQTTSPLNTARFRHGSVVVGNNIYVIGGNNIQTGPLKSVERAVVTGTTGLGSWQQVTPLAEDRELFAAATYNSYIYATGGFSSTGVITQVAYTRVLSDGSLSDWKNTTGLPFRRSAPATIALKGYLFVIGGNDEELPPRRLASVMSAKINDDGTLGEWKDVSSLNLGRAYLAVSATSEYIYAVGGQNLGPTTFPSIRSVERAKVNDDGTLGPWVTESSLMQRPRCDLASVINDDYLYALGGGSCTGPWYDSVERAKINEDGSLGAWEYVSSMTTPRFFHTAVSINHTIYAIGGQNDVGELLNTTERARLLNILHLPLVTKPE